MPTFFLSYRFRYYGGRIPRHPLGRFAPKTISVYDLNKYLFGNGNSDKQ